ncbi:MAG: TlpA family protein disulfide reductase [Sandaracinaceae bacterium]
MDAPTDDERTLFDRLKNAAPWIALAVVAGVWIAQSGSGGYRGPLHGEPAPELRVPTSEGTLDLAAERGRVVVLSFWATWCPACRQEGPVLSEVQRRVAPAGDGVVGISVDRMPLERVTARARGLGMTYPSGLGDDALAARFGVSLLPTVVVIDPEGRVADVFEGSVSADRLLEAVERARAGTPASARR